MTVVSSGNDFCQLDFKKTKKAQQQMLPSFLKNDVYLSYRFKLCYLKSKQENQNNKAAGSRKKQTNKNELSDIEEKKWMKMIKNQQAPVYMRKVQTNKESTNDEEQPW